MCVLGYICFDINISSIFRIIMSDVSQESGCRPGQKRCLSARCSKVYTALDPHLRCMTCSPRVCEKGATCSECYHLSEPQWDEWLTQQKRSKPYVRRTPSSALVSLSGGGEDSDSSLFPPGPQVIAKKPPRPQIGARMKVVETNMSTVQKD